MLHDLDNKALVIWIRAREVAVREQSGGRVAADELELFVVAHFEGYCGVVVLGVKGEQ
jgi:hypothetical protein